MTAATSAAPASAARPAMRRLGRFELPQLLGKSSLSMLWLARAPDGAEFHLLMPRQPPADAAALEDWLGRARSAARLAHPQVAPAASAAPDLFAAVCLKGADTVIADATQPATRARLPGLVT